MKSQSRALSKNVLARFQNQGTDVCYACGKKLKLGDQVVSRGKARHFHLACFESFVEAND